MSLTKSANYVIEIAALDKDGKLITSNNGQTNGRGH